MLRLDPTVFAVLLQQPIYGLISELEAEEIRRACHAETANDNATKSATSGCGSGQTAAHGTFAASNIIPLDAASRGASQLLREEAALTRRRRKR